MIGPFDLNQRAAVPRGASISTIVALELDAGRRKSMSSFDLLVHLPGRARHVTTAVALTLSAALMSTAAWPQTADELERKYTSEDMQQALQTREHYDLYGLHFD